MNYQNLKTDLLDFRNYLLTEDLETIFHDLFDDGHDLSFIDFDLEQTIRTIDCILSMI